MDHRHLNGNGDEYSVAKISSILERGNAQAIKALLRELRSSPKGQIADRAKIVCKNSEVYGYPALILECLKAWASDQQEKASDQQEKD